MSLAHLLEPLASIVVSTGLGLAGGYVLGAMRHPRVAASRFNPLPRLVPGSLRSRCGWQLGLPSLHDWPAACWSGQNVMGLAHRGLVGEQTHTVRCLCLLARGPAGCARLRRWRCLAPPSSWRRRRTASRCWPA